MNSQLRLVTALFAGACMAVTLALGADPGANALARGKGGMPRPTECGKNHYILDEPVVCSWLPVGKMATAHAGHTATRLDDGTVLVVGGTFDIAHSVEIYNPETRRFRVAPPMSTLRIGHTATLLRDGRVLVLGGDVDANQHYADVGSGEIFDPATGAWSPIAPIPGALMQFTASRLPDGRVLVAGGVDGLDNALTRAEIYDPASDSWAATDSLHERRFLHTATVLADGRVLVVGGLTDDDQGIMATTAEMYDPSSGTWRTVEGSIQRRLHTATLLPDDRVIVIGGYVTRQRPDYYYDIASLADSRIFDARTGTWDAGPDLPVGRDSHTATLINASTLLVTGGSHWEGNTRNLNVTRSLVPESVVTNADLASWVPMDAFNTARTGHTATLLMDGTVLVVGGAGMQEGTPFGITFALDTAEIFVAR